MKRMTTLISGLAVGVLLAGGAVLATAQETAPPDPSTRPDYSAGSDTSPEPTPSPSPDDTPPPAPSNAEQTPDATPPSPRETPEQAVGTREADNDEADAPAPPGQQARTQASERKALKEACKKGGWQTLEPRTFPEQAYRNQGDCVSDIASQGRSRQARLGG